MLKELKKKCDKWVKSDYAQYAVESLTEEEKSFVRYPQNNIVIDETILAIFIMRAALHYGENWYYWYKQSIKDEKTTIKTLILSIDTAYERGKFRILFLLQLFSKDDVLHHMNEAKSLSGENRKNITKYALNKDVFTYLEEAKKSNSSTANKVDVVLGEIKRYIPEEVIASVNCPNKYYNIFISYSKDDIKVAESIAISINNIFRGEVKVFFAPKDIKVGSKWKDAILEALKKYDAVITLISERTYEKPWIIAEFSAFWLQSKDIYILKYGDIDYNKIFGIFSDHQICDIENKKDIIDLIEVISKKAKISFTPFDKADDILNMIHDSLC